MPDPSGLTDDDLKAALLAHGVKAGPIVGEVALNTVMKLIFIVELGFMSLLMQFCVLMRRNVHLLCIVLGCLGPSLIFCGIVCLC